MPGSAQEKTEQATPKRLEEARRKGQVAKSTDFNGALCLMAIVILLYAVKDNFIFELQRYLTGYFSQVGHHYAYDNTPLLLMNNAVVFTLKVLAPFFTVAVLIVFIACVVQIGFLFSSEVVKPNLAVLNPLSGLQRIFSRRSLVELAKSVLKFTIIGGVTYILVRKNIESLIVLFYCSPWGIYQVIISFILKVALWAGLCYLVLALFDYLYQRYEYKKNLMMTKQEVKDEYKQMEGDQQIKFRRREIHRSISMNRIISEVPKATVVVTNPVRLAVALRYEQGEMEAPRLVAKGAGHFAAQIKKIARDHGVPVVENKEVAQFIYRNMEINQEIPLEIYQAVAQILAMVYRLKAKKSVGQ